MIRKYATFNENGKKIGGWLEGCSSIPEGAIEISAEDALKYDNGYVRGIDGKPVIMPVTEKTDKELLAVAKSTKVAELKSFLAATDYQAIKFLEGELTDEAYASMKVLRETWRLAINKIQAVTTIEEVEMVTYERYVEEG